MKEGEILKLLERAEWFFEMGIPGLVVGLGVTMIAGFSHDVVMAFIGAGITTTSLCFIELGRRYRNKVPDHEL